MKTWNELQEGVYDPNIFKAFFHSGGPGSGKSYVVQRTTGGLGMRVVNPDTAFEKLLRDANLSLKMPETEQGPRDVVRAKAKALEMKRKQNYIKGRLGLIIDGTGHEYEKITKQARELENLGYDTHMIFVNTSLDVALERNQMRPRSIPEKIVTQSWKDVQKNIGKFSNFFKGNFIIVDNNSSDENPMIDVFKRVRNLVKKEVTNSRAKAWIARELKLKKRT